jgi:hypothetical protein
MPIIKYPFSRKTYSSTDPVVGQKCIIWHDGLVNIGIYSSYTRTFTIRPDHHKEFLPEKVDFWSPLN